MSDYKTISDVVMTRSWLEAAWTFAALPADANNGDIHFEVTRWPGAFTSVRSVRALTVVDEAFDTAHNADVPYAMRRRVIGYRTLTEVSESGYTLVGRVSVHGLKRRAFTSDMLVLDAAGKLRKVAILYVSSKTNNFVTEA